MIDAAEIASKLSGYINFFAALADKKALVSLKGKLTEPGALAAILGQAREMGACIDFISQRAADGPAIQRLVATSVLVAEIVTIVETKGVDGLDFVPALCERLIASLRDGSQ